MNTLRTLFSLAALLAAVSALAQSDGRRFDAAIVLNPGMAVERGGVAFNGGYQSGLLQHGDVIYTDSYGSGSIVTSDGTVIGIGPSTTIAIDGRRIGFDVFQLVRGSAAVLGNVYGGYPLPPEFVGRIPFRVGGVVVQPDPYLYYPALVTRTAVYNVQL